MGLRQQEHQDEVGHDAVSVVCDVMRSSYVIKLITTSDFFDHVISRAIYDDVMTTSRQRAALLAGLTLTQVERLSHIEFRLWFLGELRRLDVSDRFGTGPAGATRDIAMYREIAPANLVLDPSDKVYRPGPAFHPVFEHAPQRVLTALSPRIRRRHRRPGRMRWCAANSRSR